MPDLAWLSTRSPSVFWKNLTTILAGAGTARPGAFDMRRNAIDARNSTPPDGTDLYAPSVASSILRDLQLRLTRTRWPTQIGTEPWADGTDLEFLRDLVAYWRHGFDWREQERAMNALPHFYASIDDERLHFVHLRGRGPRPIPLLLCHGWPGSFLEYRKIIPLLVDPRTPDGDALPTFDLIIPSLPGYGFSDAPKAPGMHVGQIAHRYHQLMSRVLGYPRYAAHGSDIGANVVSILGLDVPDHLLGIHVTSVTGSAIVRDLSSASPPLSEAERIFANEAASWSDIEAGYSHMQRTKPQTLAYALHDSPVGLAAWIVEKYRAWSDCDGDVTRRFSFDELLTIVTLYWVTGTIGPSMRLYYEGRLHPRRLSHGERVEVPCGVALFPHDIARPPREWGDRAYRITRWTEMPRGGHFPAHEEPELLADDIRKFFGELRAS